MHVDTKAIRSHLHAFRFAELFTQELGWDWYEAEWPVVEAGDRAFTLRGVAEKRGMVVVECAPEDGGPVPPYALRKKIETQVTKRAFEHLVIFTDGDRSQQVWQFARREHGQSVKVRELVWHGGQSGDDLVQRLRALAISLDDEDTLTLPDVVRLAQSQLDVERVTKRFYQLFDKQKNAFTKAIAGISAGGDREWYASVMLNRLMFIYFVQKKGFLDNNPDYLRTKLAECQLRLGQDQFHNFYRSFLLVLFHDGLNKRPEEHTDAFKALAGTVPYLNGGIFDIHKIETEYGDAIDIPDEAFEKIFDFFDGYRWHLDDRPIVEGNEINPDVLGYIFEKYINQKQMGAFYTKEDITGYISKNTLIPHLFDTVQRSAGSPLSYAFDLLREDPDRYIYDAIKHGWAVDIHRRDANGQPVCLDAPHALPADIAAGLDKLDQPDLIDRRKCWNRPAPTEVALPTEIWRETVHRRQRYFELREKLARGDLATVNDLITLNLNITAFAKDALDRCPDKHTLAAFWKGLTGMTVLDPTCGSGAFLFAALEILEPLYDAALNRMEGLLHDAAAAGARIHPDSHEKRFAALLDEVARHPNRTYYVLKSIIVKNLYGVDIMEEAVEICKLRLFLKLAAQAEPRPERPNFGIEPLPDIDFNIKAGNTLVGFATESEVRRVLTQEGDQMKMLMDDELFGYERVEMKLLALDSLYQTFCAAQLEGDDTGRSKVKAKIRDELHEVTAVLDDALAREYGVKPESPKFAAWKTSHQPFHWFCEFFGIMKNGGFDVVIGNPPYVEFRNVRNDYKLQKNHYASESADNLYAFCMERSTVISRSSSRFGMIVPSGLLGLDEVNCLREILLRKFSNNWFSTFGIRPSKLFDGVDQRLCIQISASSDLTPPLTLRTTDFLHWNAEERPILFENAIHYQESFIHQRLSRIPQLGSRFAYDVIDRIEKSNNCTAEHCFVKLGGHLIHYHRSPRYWIRGMNFEQYFKSATRSKSIHHFRDLRFTDESYADFVGSILNSTLFFFWFLAVGNGRNVTGKDVSTFPIGKTHENTLDGASRIFLRLMEDYKANSVIRERSDCEFQEFRPSLSKPIIDEIDKVLGEHYGFTPEELDFIINYDIKYRMGLGRGGGGGENDA
ncbi:MAG: Eco57I restriction-modification methylase domain-containing protein [Opitutales bacterium]|nr:Eco57I restriction-modification methylase domain-containing protein [Opitutales bacterium]